MDDKIARNFWNRVDALLKDKTMKSFCQEIGINYNSVRNCKSGAAYVLPRLETGYLIAQGVGSSLEYLLTGSDTRPESKGDRLYAALLEQAPAVLQGLIDTYIEKRDTSSAPRMA